MLNLPTKDQRNDHINTVYAFFENSFGVVPKPLQMLSTSPGLFSLQNESIQYYASHEALSFPLLTAIRYITASRLNFPACVEFNALLLARQGMTEEEIEELATNPKTAPLEDKETLMLCFIVKSLDGEISQGDMQSLLDHGWRQADIIDAVNHSFAMIASGKMMDLFRLS